ncbi:MAG: RNA polymerase sigma factor [Planctomycetes bacterium]|nr:RNA polymerase sigma factor [Planctomycetota bacterium]
MTDAAVSNAYQRFGPRLRDYAIRMIRDRDRAEDVVQETFLRLCREDVHALEPRLAEWLFTVCRNCALDQLRKEKHMYPKNGHESQVQEIAGDAAPPLSFESDASGLLKIIAMLPENQREVIYLKFQNDLSYEDISKITGHSRSNVGFLIHAGMKQLREIHIQSSNPSEKQHVPI